MRRDELAGKRPAFPISHIIGLPGSGKTTLAEQLPGKLKSPLTLHIFFLGRDRLAASANRMRNEMILVLSSSPLSISSSR